ncbi:hypothetical protein DQ04_00881050 [Trypanosoma grayi]|uniref:hypothetical protein n=1 Tax=Trypanosoma grayi TaxID=71804 RepID=UPI0004F44795|nr:hypothetical protein DQ04_00881050 [Trypanosoma grayi]KEG13637.1 hypothetical protein DQ04_00881050 [Trypanosoma grayi]
MTPSHDVGLHGSPAVTHHPTAVKPTSQWNTTACNSFRSSSSKGGSNATQEISSDIMTRYERMIAVLTAQALSQQEEIAQLKNAMFNAAGLCNDGSAPGNNYVEPPTRTTSSRMLDNTRTFVESKPQRTATRGSGTRRMPKGWRRRIEDHMVGLLETHMRCMDERLARCLVERFRQVTRQHVIRSVEKEVLRVLHEKPLPVADVEPRDVSVDPTATPQCSAAPPQIHVANEESAWRSVKPATYMGDQQQNRQRPQRVIENGVPTEPHVSTIAGDPSSLSESAASLLRHHDQLLLEQLQRRVATLEDRLAVAATSFSSKGTSPPSLANATCHLNGHSKDDGNRTHLWFSSRSPTNSASDDVGVLVDVFEGRKPPTAVRLLSP